MNTLIWTAALLSIGIIYSCKAFTPAYSPSTILSSTTPSTSTSRLYGINEWRDDALQSKYTLDSYKEESSAVTSTVPILPFPFSDLLLQGQRTQLNLYEQRFHELFQDAIDNHCGMVGMGLLAGNGMITTLPLCEIESFTRLGYEDNWINKRDGMGNGSIFVTIRAVGRCKIISEDGLIQEEPYMKATVMELVDEDITESGVREKSNSSTVSGESSPIEIASLVASNIENEMVSLANMEHRLKELEDSVKQKKKEKEEEEKKKTTPMGKSSSEEDGDEVMNRRLVEAQLESLFMQDSSEGVDIENTATDDDDDDDEEDDDEDESAEGSTDNDEKMDRVAQFQTAFENAVEIDTFGYKTIKLQSEQAAIRTPKDITAISWAAFCTGDTSNMQREVMKIQALDMTNVLQRLHLAAAMLMEEKKKLRAKMALAGIKESDSDSLQSDE